MCIRICFDEAGHLAQVWLNGSLLEECAYNQAGQRVRSRSGNRSWSYKYDAAGRLVDSGQECFSYDARAKNMAEILYPNMRNPESSSALHRLFGSSAGGKVTLLVGCDQVGTPKIFVREDGSLYKKIFYDSFGNVLHDSAPQLFMPVGFADGLHDRDTVLVRFGYRYYDAKTGRFTAPDPARDLRGDADLYDYCVDDPVSRVDPSGLAAEEVGSEDSLLCRHYSPVFCTGENHPRKQGVRDLMHAQGDELRGNMGAWLKMSQMVPTAADLIIYGIKAFQDKK